jgi:hypothetical protein
MADTERMAGYDLLKTGTLVHFDITKTEVERPEHIDETLVRVELQLGEVEDDERTNDVEWGAFGFIYVLGLQSFADARPRGVSDMHFEENDEFGVADLIAHLRYERGRVCFAVDYLRGRCVKTDITVSPDGKVVLETRCRGEAALRWVDRLKGKKPLQLVTPAEAKAP